MRLGRANGGRRRRVTVAVAVAVVNSDGDGDGWRCERGARHSMQRGKRHNI